MPRRSAFRWSRTFARRTCWPGGRERRWFRCWTTCCLPTQKRGRVLQNIGGIANLTAIPARRSGGSGDRLRYRAREHGDRCAGAGAFRQAVRPQRSTWPRGERCWSRCWPRTLRNPYFRLKPPRTAGREQFGREYAAEFLVECRRHSKRPEDALATATALTAETIAQSYKTICPAADEERARWTTSSPAAERATRR